MARKIFISYRRDDDRAMAARIRDRLAQMCGDENVFMDVDNLVAGERFDAALAQALNETDVLLVIMGPRWLKLLSARLAINERDYVQEEIATAIKLGIKIVPVVIDGTSLPQMDQVPASIRGMLMYQKHDVRHESFGRDMSALAQSINVVPIHSNWRTSPYLTWPRSWSMWAVGLISAYACLVIWFQISSNVFNVRGAVVAKGADTLVEILGHPCPDESFPLHVRLKNNAFLPAQKVSFFVIATKTGFSSELGRGMYTTDKIIAPGETYAACWKMPLLKGEISEEMVQRSREARKIKEDLGLKFSVERPSMDGSPNDIAEYNSVRILPVEEKRNLNWSIRIDNVLW